MKTLIATIVGMVLTAGVASAAPIGIPGPPWLPGNGGGGDNGGEAHAVAEASAEAVAVQGQVQGQLQGQFAETGNNVTSISVAPRLPASSAADLMLANCQKGASAQGFGGGGSIGSTDEVCHLFALYALREARGERGEADQVLEEITDIMKIRTNPVRRAFQAIPLIGNIF